jgi:hypothetical protein
VCLFYGDGLLILYYETNDRGAAQTEAKRVYKSLGPISKLTKLLLMERHSLKRKEQKPADNVLCMSKELKSSKE